MELPKNIKSRLDRRGNAFVWKCFCCDLYTTDGVDSCQPTEEYISFAMGVNTNECKMCSLCGGLNCILCTKKMKKCFQCGGEHCPKCEVKNKGECIES